MTELHQQSILPADSFSLKQAFKEFSLESERLEFTYRHLQERFEAVQSTLQESHTKLAGKLAELDFLSRYLETILNHISQGILFIDSQGIVTTYNFAAEQILQLPSKDLLFHPIADFFKDDFFGFSLKKAFASKECPPSIFVSWQREGQNIELEVEAAFVKLNAQTFSVALRPEASPPVQGLLLLLRDITKIRRLQQAANRHDRLKELGELAAHLAHEIRNPLGGIKGFANLLHQELDDRPDLKQMASHIVEGADALNRFVSNVLVYARPPRLEIENIDLVALIEELRQWMLADSSWNPKIVFQILPSVPHLWVPLDAQLMKTALLNLFVNAVQAMPQGGTLTVSLENDLSWATIRVEDTGGGIPAELLQKIFTPFFTTKEEGNGLGLSEVQKVIQAHQGWIDVQTELEHGTVFSIKIPLKVGE